MLEDIFIEDLHDYFYDEASQDYADSCADAKERSEGYDWYK